MKTSRYFSYRLCLMGLVLFSWLAAQAQTAVEAWVRRYSSSEASSQDYAHKVVTDLDGNIVVAGESDDGFTGRDILLIKYSASGLPLWTNRHDTPGHTVDFVSDLAMDDSGNIFVTGYS